jgi:ABC-type polysaccharide/polyol phosphate export permease
MVSWSEMQQIKEIANSRNLLWNLTLRELRSKYRRSVLGWSWSLLNPLAQMAIYTFVFGLLFGAKAPTGDPSGVTTYGLYLLTGIIPWGFFALICGVGLQSILSNTNLVRKVAFARESLVLSQVLFCFVQFSIEMSLVCLVLLIAGSAVLPWLPVTVLLMVLMACFAGGIALILSVSAVFFRDLPYLWTIINQLWFFATPVIYDPKIIDGKVPDVLQSILHWNPTAVFIRSFRATTYHGTAPEWRDLGTLFLSAAISLVIGFATFNKLKRRLAEEL